ncbi:Nucleoside-diphosphate-sugar epimerase [Nannocystis exedens]|uniref:Nucleoside-diphosphate-sugar epimerase n=1 Tax=Nannocystis exedens TaxID=54 RepID=A0A1I1SPC3_9BACT|nr:NAD-dependent epimerase/dehydratase family protein [Nannocystis exedens]PCC75643.1 NAD dependent epimerase/dehydratase family protein [Nannocystis exedens]SFD48345.1 Nucleoside-diphosphate-sugar epimerase [Nannocystis exedens]
MQATSAPLHVVLGAGQIGGRVVELLRARGLRVRQVRRSAVGVGPELVAGDITDLDFARRAVEGAAVVYDCMNPAYHRWPQELLPMARGALHGARHAGARLVALDCLYMYGRPGGPMREDSPQVPCSKKGELRVKLGELRLAADRRGDVPVAIARASDFFGADLAYAVWNDRFFRRVLAGRKGQMFGDPDLPHAYTYVEDVARALVTLGTSDRGFGHVWHVPTPPAESTRSLTQRLGRALGRDADVTSVPRWLVRTLGLVSPTMREMAEMIYQWEVPFEVDDSKFRAAFGWSATPVDEAVARTAAWARTRYGLAPAREASARP